MVCALRVADVHGLTFTDVKAFGAPRRQTGLLRGLRVAGRASAKAWLASCDAESLGVLQMP